MGKFATYRKRGSTPPGEGNQIPPPAPGLYAEAGHFWQQANGRDDTLGRVKLWLADFHDGPYAVLFNQSWQNLHDWGEYESLTTGFYRTTEVGNGKTYLGESNPSNILYVG